VFATEYSESEIWDTEKTPERMRLAAAGPEDLYVLAGPYDENGYDLAHHDGEEWTELRSWSDSARPMAVSVEIADDGPIPYVLVQAEDGTLSLDRYADDSWQSVGAAVGIGECPCTVRTTPDGDVYVAHYVATSTPEVATLVHRYADGKWKHLGEAAGKQTPREDPWLDNRGPEIEIDASGNVYLVRVTGDSARVFVWRSQEWLPYGKAFEFSVQPADLQLDIDADGVPHVAFVDGTLQVFRWEED
jgi:hypothetical protein